MSIIIKTFSLFFLLIPVCTFSPLLQSKTYEDWKNNKVAEWKHLKISTFAQACNSLTTSILRSLDEQQNVPKTTFYAYHFLRELLHVSPPRSFTDINQEWLINVAEEADTYLFMEEYKAEPATDAQIELLQKAKNLLNLKDKIPAFSWKDVTSAGRAEIGGKSVDAIFFSQNSNPALEVFELYHELGHILYQDNAVKQLIMRGSKTMQELLDDSQFKATREYSTRAIQLGKKAFDASTKIGKHVIDIMDKITNNKKNLLVCNKKISDIDGFLKSIPAAFLQWFGYCQKYEDVISGNENFWVIPRDTSSFQNVLYSREIENRADIFAANSLIEQGKLDVIFRMMAQLATSYVIAQGDQDLHSSDFERLLCIAGFLVDNGIDINAELKTWYEKKQCRNEESTGFSFFQNALNQGAMDFRQAYLRWHKK